MNNPAQTKTMDKSGLEKVIAVLCAMTGGGIRFTTLQLNPFVHLDFWEKLIPAVITAAACAFSGLVVKEMWSWGRKRYIRFKRNNKL